MKNNFLAYALFATFLVIGCKNSTEPDTTPPNVTITTPQNGAEVSGLSIIRANVSDNGGILKVEFLLDGSLLAVSEDTSEPFEYAWDTKPYETGSQHSISARAYDTSDNQKDSEAIIVTVNNDAATPSISIVSPIDQAVISEIVLIRALAVDDQGIAAVSFQIDGFLLENSTDSTEPYEFSLNTVSYENGSSHVLTAIASDIVGNVTISSPVAVIIDNSQAIPTQVNILPVMFDNSSFVIKWHRSPDDDFDSYKLDESFSADMSGQTAIFTSSNKEDTTYVVPNVSENEIRYYRLTITDTVGLETASSIKRAGAFQFPTDGLVAYYPFNGNADDASGNGNHGEVISAVLIQDRHGNANSAFSFDGVNDYIQVPYSSSLDIAGSLGISVWAKGIACQACGGSLSGIVAKGPIVPYGLGIDDGDRILFRVVSSGTFFSALDTNNHIDPSQWYHYVGVFEAGEYIKLYINGDEVVSIISGIPLTVDKSSQGLWIGSRAPSQQPSVPFYYFQGVIDDVRIYNRALNKSEIEQLFLESE